MPGLDEEVLICLWHRQETTGTARTLLALGMLRLLPSFRPNDHTQAFDYILFSKKASFVPLRLADDIIKAFFF